MPSLTFVLPHWVYWSGLLLFPLAAMVIVRHKPTHHQPGEVNLPTAYMFWLMAGFVGIHRFYLRSWWGLIFIPLFIAVLLGNNEIRKSRVVLSNADNQLMIADFDLENAQKAVQEGREGAADKVTAAKAAMEDVKAKQAAADAVHNDWNTFTISFAAVIAALLLIDALLLPRITRRVSERERAARAAHPPKEVHDIREGTAGRGHPADKINTSFTRAVDRLSGFSGEFVCYWSVLAVFAYYYEVIARYVFNSPTNWVHESMFLMFGMQYLISGALALREDSHVRVDVIYLMFSDRTKAIMNVVTSVFFFIFNGALLWSGIVFAMDSVNVWEVSFTEWAIQYWPVKLTIALGALLILLQGAATLVRDVLYLQGREA